jgi:hypothetical protein
MKQIGLEEIEAFAEECKRVLSAYQNDISEAYEKITESEDCLKIAMSLKIKPGEDCDFDVETSISCPTGAKVSDKIRNYIGGKQQRLQFDDRTAEIAEEVL